MVNDAGISMHRLLELNVVLEEKREARGTSMWLGYFYRVARNGDRDLLSVTNSTTVLISTIGAVKLMTTHDGIDSRCNKLVVAREQDAC
jgi:hypothetical protein